MEKPMINIMQGKLENSMLDILYSIWEEAQKKQAR